MNLHRRQLCSALALSACAPFAAAQPDKPFMEVWKAYGCGCCDDWIAYIEKNGFVVKVTEGGNNDARRRLKLPGMYSSCHTALVNGYVVEGHVPAREIHRLLKEKPKALGIAVPVMPLGSPGMDGPKYGNRSEPYVVILVQHDGSATIYQSYP
jgi:hypothetical protein